MPDGQTLYYLRDLNPRGVRRPLTTPGGANPLFRTIRATQTLGKTWWHCWQCTQSPGSGTSDDWAHGQVGQRLGGFVP